MSKYIFHNHLYSVVFLYFPSLLSLFHIETGWLCSFPITFIFMEVLWFLPFVVRTGYTCKQAECLERRCHFSLAYDSSAHSASLASHCKCPLHQPRKQESLSSPVSAASAAEGFWGKLVYPCLPAQKPGLYLSCGLQLTLKTFRLQNKKPSRTELAFSLQSPLKQLIISHVCFVHIHH